MLTRAAQFTFLTVVGVALLAQRDSGERAAWNEPVKPFRIIGNIYYVGVSGVTSFLITTPQGHILLDGGFPETAPLIEKNIATLGFRIQDVKILLNSHAHYDHCGGLAELKRLSGAQMVASRADGEVLESGGRVSFEGWKNSGFPAVKVDRVIADGETVQLGDVSLTAVLTPGHTKGCTTWTMPVTESGKNLSRGLLLQHQRAGLPAGQQSEISADCFRLRTQLRETAPAPLRRISRPARRFFSS